MDKPRVSCPECGAVFEIQEEYRGEQVDCPRCAVPFQIPLTGAVGVRISAAPAPAPAQAQSQPPAQAQPQAPAPADDSTFEVSCPHCQVVFEVPAEYRNELAECSECTGVFRIPPSGSQGEIVPDDELPPLEEEPEPEPAPPQPAPAPSPLDPFAGPPQLQPPAEITGTGIQQGTTDRSTKRTGTVRLSRNAVVGNTMTPKRKTEEQMRQERHRRKQSGVLYDPVTGEATHQPISDPLADDDVDSLSEDDFIADDSTSDGRAAGKRRKKRKRKRVRVVTLPTWVQGMELDEDEEIRGCELARKTVSLGQLFVTFLPVLVIPVACFASTKMGVSTSAVVFAVVGSAFWGIHALTVFAVQSKKALVVTTDRAILITADEILKVDIDHDEDD